MKKLLYVFAVIAILFGCTGKDGSDGAIGPKGDKGEVGGTGPKGDAGPKGANGTNGTNGSQARIYDAAIDLSKSSIYDFPATLKPTDIVFVYLMHNEGFYAPLPFTSYSYTQDGKNFLKLSAWFTYCEYFVSFRNDTNLPTGATFLFRIVVVNGSTGGRINMERYKNYENLKVDFGLKD